MRRALSFAFTGLIAVVLLTAASLTSTAPASAATTIAPTTTCSNGVDTTPGLGLICRVTIINTITPSGTTADVTVRECHGAAGDPNASCDVSHLIVGSQVTNVNQCNGSILGGGGTLRCSVNVTNDFIGVVATKSQASVNQCVGSGNPGALTGGCDPFPATTANAQVTQCNGSANGGTLVELTCTVTGTQTSNHNVRINQCNGSGNGGGSLVICTANVTNHIIAAVTPPPTAAPTAVPTAVPTAAPTAVPTAVPTGAPTTAPTGAPTTAPTGAPTLPPLTPAPTQVNTTPAPTQVPLPTPRVTTAPGPDITPRPTTAPGPNRTPRPTTGPLPNTSTELGTDRTAGGSGPLLPIGLMFLVGLALVGWYRRGSRANNTAR